MSGSFSKILQQFQTLEVDSGQQNEIEENAKLIETLVLSAKSGQWDNVWGILGTPDKPRKAFLLNVIPETRRWGVMHQAVYWNIPDILQMLLSFKECDSNIQAKECRSEVGLTSGNTPLQVAQAYKHKKMESILSQIQCSLSSQEMDTFQPPSSVKGKNGLRLIQLTLAAYKNTFHPSPIDPRKSVEQILQEIFEDMKRSEARWKAIRDKVADAFYVISTDTQKKFEKCKSREDFFHAVINKYTEESNFLYTHLNTAMRRQRTSGYKPTGDDMALGPYVVMYQMLLMFWEKLPVETGITYRRMELNEADTSKYKVGTSFSWLSFVSSSAQKEYAISFPTCNETSGDKSVVFTITNSKRCARQPRNIEEYAMYMEKERTYPAGATFVVTERKQVDEETHIAISLIA